MLVLSDVCWCAGKRAGNCHQNTEHHSNAHATSTTAHQHASTTEHEHTAHQRTAHKHTDHEAHQHTAHQSTSTQAHHPPSTPAHSSTGIQAHRPQRTHQKTSHTCNQTLQRTSIPEYYKKAGVTPCSHLQQKFKNHRKMNRQRYLDHIQPLTK